MIKILIQFIIRLLIFLIIMLLSLFIVIAAFDVSDVFDWRSIKKYLFDKKFDWETTFTPIKNIFNP